MKPQHVLVTLLAAVGLVLLWGGMKTGGGASVPAFTEDANNVIAGHLATIPEIGVTTWTAHRYPSRTGGELSAIIHGGWSQASIPCVPGSLWMVRPPPNESLLS